MEKGYGTFEHVSAMSDMLRKALWYASMSLQGYVVDWSTGTARRPS